MPERPSLLIVDDNPGDVDLVTLALEQVAPEVEAIAAYDGREACARLQGMSDADLARCRLMLLDLNMPRMDGRELLRWIRGQPRFAQLPIIVLTSSTVATERAECVALGAKDFWVKSANYDLLEQQMGQVRRYLDG